MSEIRKLILGVTTQFSKSPSWLVIPDGIKFEDPRNPWQYVTEKTMSLTKSTDYMNFLAIKMGDVNNSAAANANGKVQSRTAGELSFVIDEANLTAGENYKLQVRSSDFKNISGYQFTLNFDAKLMTYEGFESGVLNVNDANFGTTFTEKGLLTTSWNADKAISFGKEEVLFTLVFKALKNGSINGAIDITSDVTLAEAYNEKLEAKEMKLELRSKMVKMQPVYLSCIKMRQTRLTNLQKLTSACQMLLKPL
ncbi:MAG: hypothetical protein IPI30_18140 [Saprospiraceae bacterium]|nr:hypothetical protein [Candidatus Vicinibacter affinis]